MTVVHQAIYGDKGGSFALLKTSLTNTELAKRICNATDLLDRPSNGYLTQSVVRGFALNDHYIFIKSFPDNDPLVRKGRVLSHALIVELEDLHQINDLEYLFSFFLSEPDKDPELSSIVINCEHLDSNTIINKMSREAATINGLLDHSSYNNTVVWIGKDGYSSFVSQLWKQLEGSLRASLNLGVGFNPQKIDTNKLNILYVMEDYESRWKSSGFCIIGKEETGLLESLSSFRLAGQNDKCRPLDDLIRIFGIIPSEIEDFLYIETGVNTYKNLSTKTEFNSLIVFCDLITKYSPNPKLAKVEKEKVLKHVTSRIELATADQIIKLKNPNWNGFIDAEKSIGEKITNWTGRSLVLPNVDASMINLVVAAFDSGNSAEWWKRAFTEGLKAKLKNWKSTYAIQLWSWFLTDHDLVMILEDLIPTNSQVESDFINYWKRPDQKLAKNMRSFAKNRKWLSLHGLSTLMLLSPEESIKSQLMIDTNPEFTNALEKMGESISDKEFIKLTIKLGELRLIKISGEKVARVPSLLGGLDAKNIIWRQIWLESIERGMQPYDAIKKPEKILFELLEEVVNGIDIEPELLLMFSKSDYNDLSSFRLRAEVWSRFEEVARSGFIVATTLGCVRLIDDEDINISDLENDIRVCLSNADVITQVIGEPTIKVSTKLLLFKELTALKEKELLILLNAVVFSPIESEDLGKLIFRRHWNKVALAIADKISSRNDLGFALKECHSLLGVFDKLKLSFSGHLSEAISTEEWWYVFSEQCYTKYPKGPADKGLWGRSGGENYDLHTTGTGREIWADIISKMRNKRTDVDANKLLQEMSKDYSNSPELKQLIKTYNNYA